MIDKDLEDAMDTVLKVTTLGHAARNLSGLKNRQPLSQMFVQAPRPLEDYYLTIVEDELNVKKVEFTKDTGKFMSYSFKPQLKSVGPKYGKLVGKIRQALASISDGRAAQETLSSGGALHFDFDGTPVDLYEDDVLVDIKQVPGFVAQSEGDLTVALDTNLTPELIEEGYVNEVVSKVQTMRKDAGFEVTDHIVFAYGDNEKLASIILSHAVEICAVTLCDKVQKDAGQDFYTKEWDINGEKAVFGVKRI